MIGLLQNYFIRWEGITLHVYLTISLKSLLKATSQGHYWNKQTQQN